MTAFAFEHDRKRCMEAGVDAYMTKPVDFTELVSLIGEVSRS